LYDDPHSDISPHEKYMRSLRKMTDPPAPNMCSSPVRQAYNIFVENPTPENSFVQHILDGVQRQAKSRMW
jgi:hypothetical protein